MDSSTIWWILCGLLIAIELTVGTLYLLLIATGAALAAVLGYFELSFSIQIVAAALLSVISCGVLYAWRKCQPSSAAELENSNTLDRGQIVMVHEWQSDHTALVHYRGAQWQARLLQHKLHSTGVNSPATSSSSSYPAALRMPSVKQIPASGAHSIVAVEGNVLILQALEPVQA